MSALVVAHTSIRRDAEGRYCINDLHNAAGGAEKHRPALWLKLKHVNDLRDEVAKHSESYVCPLAVTRGRYGGTYAVKELVYAYAMWVSPTFHLAVIRAYDQLVTQRPPAPPASTFAVPQSLPEALRLAADLAEQKAEAEAALAIAAPKAAGFDRIAESSGSMTLTEAAKHLQEKPRAFTEWLRSIRWIYKLGLAGDNLAYQDKLDADLLEHKTTTLYRAFGGDLLAKQVRVTPKGLAKLAEMLSTRNEMLRPWQTTNATH